MLKMAAERALVEYNSHGLGTQTNLFFVGGSFLQGQTQPRLPPGFYISGPLQPRDPIYYVYIIPNSNPLLVSRYKFAIR